MNGRGVRVAIVTTSYPAHPTDAAGHFVRAHALALREVGHAVTVFGPGRLHREQGVEIESLGGARLFGWPGAAARLATSPHLAPAFARFAWRARRQLARQSPFDRVFAHWLVPSVWPLTDGLSGPIEGIAHGADVRLLRGLPSFVRVPLVEHILARTDRLRFVAQASLDALSRALPSPLSRGLRERSYVEPMPMVVPARDSLLSAERLGLPARYVAFVGRLVPDKRVALAIAAAARARLPIVVVGDGPSAPEASSNLRWLGARPRDEALAVIAHAAALLHTSSTEAAPTVVREARALGVRVIACRAGDIEAWANVDRGIHLVPDDVEGIAGALRALP